MRYPPLRYYLERVLRDMGGYLALGPLRECVEGRSGGCFGAPCGGNFIPSSTHSPLSGGGVAGIGFKTIPISPDLDSVRCQAVGIVIMIVILSGPLNRLNAILSLLHPLDRYRTPSAIGSAIGRPISRPISHPNTGGSPQPPRSKPLGGLNRAIVAL